MNKRRLDYELRFLTPAFLGNAEQKAEWRTPPFKALLRQWWRVVHAESVAYNVDQLRRDEAALFGSASDEKDDIAGQSRVRLRLDVRDKATLENWVSCGTVHHPEVGANGQNVGADLYLGYGPLGYERGQGTVLAKVKETAVMRTAMDPAKASARLRLLCPAESHDELKWAVQLIAWFGTVGSRSRNGWGSIAIAGEGIAPLTRGALNRNLRPIQECLQLEWPHAVGSDQEGPLVWITPPLQEWREGIRQLAAIKIRLRTEPNLLSLSGKRDGDVVPRHLLGYPLTNHAALGPVNPRDNDAGWVAFDPITRQPKKDRNGKYIQSARLANQLRFKVAETGDGKLRGLVFHLPCKAPDELVSKLSSGDQRSIRSSELAVWQAVHQILDKHALRLK